jgi:hypothetical protein
MRRAALAIILAIVLGVTPIRLSADSRPALSGLAAGIELCPQFICGFALFAGQFQGTLNSRPASGHFIAGLVHAPLPPIGQIAPIFGGRWIITANRRILQGDVTGGGILNLNDTQFCVSIEMSITEGGSGELFFSGVLDHGPFPPGIFGAVTQAPTPCPIVP